MVSLPFKEEAEGDGWIIRRFSAGVPDEELTWHRDGEDRDIILVSGEGWEFQRDNMLPVLLKKGECHSIHRGEWHRLVKGSGEAVLRIKKL
jgi:quercetin dioxygenase-like cupin family protein